ncbi:MFS transporter [Leeia sp.]|uniref:MFS transporter n=1 Tax=Leeia sp. TaxID=2884678 RepID=UPI0035ADD604
MSRPISWLYAAVLLNLVSGLAQLGQYGIAFPLLPLALQQRGVAPAQIGLLCALPWVGMAAGVLLAPWLMQRIQAWRTVLIGLLLGAVTIASLGDAPLYGWWLLTPLLGLALGLRWIGNESWLYRLVPPQRRGVVVGLHETVIAIALLAGPLLIGWLGSRSLAIWYLAAGFGLLAILPLWLARQREPDWSADAVATSATVVFWNNPACALGVLAGLLDTGAMSLFPSFAAQQAASPTQQALLIAVLGGAGLLSQLPLGWLSDRLGSRTAVLACLITAILAAVLTGLASPQQQGPLWLAAACLGIMGNGMLTLSIVVATEQPGDARLAMRDVSLAFTFGSVLGPALLGSVMQHVGAGSYSWVLLAFALIPMLWLPRLRPALPSSQP